MSGRKTCANVLGASFDAQPAQDASAVKRIGLSICANLSKIVTTFLVYEASEMNSNPISYPKRHYRSEYSYDTITPVIGAWRSPVACLHGVQEVVGSNPAAPTKDQVVICAEQTTWFFISEPTFVSEPYNVV